MSFERLNVELPESFTFNGRRFFQRSKIEHLKHKLIARSLGQADPAYVEPTAEAFVNASVVARELGISRRTMARRMKEVDDLRGVTHPQSEELRRARDAAALHAAE